MRRLAIALAALAGSALAGAAIAGAQVQVARSEADARRLCGPKPSADPHLRCIGRPRGQESHTTAEQSRVSLTFQKIVWGWATGGKTASDDWTTH
jgi:hypothetical protein